MNSATASKQLVKKRKPQERAEATKSKLLDAAISEFAERGYDAVTIRDIEVAADVQRGLLNYHFGDKEQLWKEAVDRLFRHYKSFRAARSEVAKDLPATERLAFRVRAFIRFSAAHPELNRLMIQEGNRDSWRLAYIVENYLRDRPELRVLVQSDLALSDEEFIHWNYLFLGGALVFCLPSEAKQVFGIDIDDEEFITRHAKFVAEFLVKMCPKVDVTDDSD